MLHEIYFKTNKRNIDFKLKKEYQNQPLYSDHHRVLRLNAMHTTWPLM